MSIPRTFGLAALALASLALAPAAEAQSYTTQLFVSGLKRPVWMASVPGDSSRMFVAEQWKGRLRVVQNGTLLTTPYLDIETEISATGPDGLLCFAFHPDYENNGRLYILYTNTDGDSVLEEFTTSATDPNVADMTTRQVIMGPIFQPSPIHNIGCMVFGPDGMLYVAAADGGLVGDPDNNGQDGDTPLGKMLRLDVDQPFPHVPLDNPFLSDPLINDEIYSFGLRMPWRFSFDRETDDLWLTDVGEASAEEINFVPAGTGPRNYGWRCLEGSICTPFGGCTCSDPLLHAPIHEYPHTNFRCAIIGGYRYRGTAIPELYGEYFFADFCASRIWTLAEQNGLLVNVTERTAQLDPPGAAIIQAISSFGEDAEGELYICDLTGNLWKIVPTDGPVVPGTTTAICFGDGGDQMGCTDCPCSNNAAPATPGGCLNSTGSSAVLTSGGAPQVAQDTLSFSVTGASVSTFGVLIAGINALPNQGPCPPGSGIVGVAALDGLRCAGGSLRRHGSRATDVNGDIGVTNNPWGPPGGPAGGILNQGPYAVGQTRVFQVFYREDPSLQCMSGQNTTNAITVTMGS